MGKRFTDTAIWDRVWYRKLSPAEKVAFNYIKDRCDNVGVWCPDTELADFIIGEPIDWESFLSKLNSNIVVLNNGKWWLTDFCDFQYGQLSPDCKPHQSYIKLLKKHTLWEGYSKGIHTLQEKDKDKELDKELDKDKEKDTEGLQCNDHVTEGNPVGLFVTQKNPDKPTVDFEAKIKKLQQNEPYIETAQLLLDLCLEEDPNFVVEKKREATVASWADDIRKLVVYDKRSLKVVGDVIVWIKRGKSKQANFWRPVVRSASGLRRNFPTLFPQYFENLEESKKE